MDSGAIEKLLDKYFEANTTIAEEKQLKAYFSSPDVAPHLEQYRPVFGYFESADTQHFDKPLPLQPKKRYGAWLSVAASIVVLFGLFMFLNQKPLQENDLGTYKDPEVAFRETQKALNMLSKNVNVGVNSMNYLEEYEKTRKTIFKE